MTRMSLLFRAIREDEPGPKLRELFVEFWPSYRAWFTKEGDAGRPTYAECVRALRAHMPELMPTYEQLVDLAGGGDAAARFLSLWRPTPYLTGCSQVLWTRDDVALVRNYDYSPDLCDAVILRSEWSGTPVLAATDCIWGVLDGMNEAGLAVALAFGGRKVVGDGFGLPLVLRYVLQMAETAKQAVAILSRVPVHMAYNVAIIDRSADYATVFVSPDRPVVVKRAQVSTNHQERIEWPQHATLTQTFERMRYLDECLDQSDETLASLTDRFLERPLFRTSYDRGWGTLYTVSYHPRDGIARFLWPDRSWPLAIEGFEERAYRAIYTVTSAAAPSQPEPASSAREVARRGRRGGRAGSI